MCPINLTPALAALLLLPVALPTRADAGQASRNRTLDQAVSSLAASDQLGNDGQNKVIEQPAGPHYELGAVVDVRAPDPRGLPVLAVTPAGSAARLGLAPGDRLLSVNGSSMEGSTGSPADLLDQAMQAGHGKVELRVRRGERLLQLSGTADVVAVPAYRLEVGQGGLRGCGYVTTQEGVVPKSQAVFPAEITRIDGRSTPLEPLNRFPLATGTHVLRIAEHIPDTYLNSAQLTQIHKMKKLSIAGSEYKDLVVDIAPGTSYRIGARLLRDKLDIASLRGNAYWEPVVWAQVPQACP